VADVGQNWLEDSVIRLLGTAEGRKLQPENEGSLEGEIPGNVIEDNAEREPLDKVEEPKDNPVSQPLHVVIVTRALESLEREVGREGPANEVGDWSGKRVHKVEEGAENDCTDEKVALGDLCSLLKVVHNRVLGQLFVELSDIVVGVGLSLFEDRMFLNFLLG